MTDPTEHVQGEGGEPEPEEPEETGT